MGLVKGKSNWNCYIALLHEHLVYLQKITCVIGKYGLMSDGFRSASGGTPKCSWLVESMRPCQLLCWKNQLSQAVVVKETR